MGRSLPRSSTAISTASSSLSPIHTATHNATSSTWTIPVFLYLPNVIGYLRLAAFFTALSIATHPGYAGIFFWLYFFSYALDAVDGPAARYLKQESRFGAVLDMVADRVCTAALLALLACDYARAGSHGAASGALALLVLDVGAHWVQTSATGALRLSSHKTLPDEPALLAWYYRRTNLFLVCLGSESHLAVVFLLARAAAAHESLGALDFSPWVGAQAPAALVAAFSPPIVQAFINSFLPALPTSGSPGATSLAAWLALATLPVFLLKQVISIVQLTRAAQRLLKIDQDERKRMQR